MERKTNKKYDNYKTELTKENYDRIGIYLIKGMREKIKETAAKYNLSSNAWINKAIQEKIERDSISDPDSTDSE